MTEYLLSVHGPVESDEFGSYGSKEEMEEAFAATGAFNDKLQAEGYRVFAGGLQPASTATVVDGQGDTPVMTDGPYLETAEGHDLVRECLALDRPGRYQVLAAINAVHTDARSAADTDWSQVVALYDRLSRLDPSPIVALNRAVAVAELDGPDVALALVDRLPLTGYHAWHATRADLLRRLGRSTEAKAAYDVAIDATLNTAERAYLSRKRGELV